MQLKEKIKEATHTAPVWMQKEGIAHYWKQCGDNWLALMEEVDDNDNVLGWQWVLTERKAGQGFVEKLEEIDNG